MEEKILNIEAMRGGINTSVKRMQKSNKCMTESIQEFWHTVKRPNLRRIQIEGNDALIKGTENTIIIRVYERLNTRELWTQKQSGT